MKAQNRGACTLTDALFNMVQRLFPNSALPGSPVFRLMFGRYNDFPVVVNGAAETWLGGDTSGSMYILNINKLTVHLCTLFV